MCGEPRAEHVGQTLKLAGWVARRRDHGGLVFVDLRDRSGLMQLVINPERSSVAAELAKEIRNEFVLQVSGEVVARSLETVNSKMPTGEFELQVDELEIVSRSTPLPFQLDEEGVDETLRLRYRWLDLRREKLQRNLRLRAQMVGIIRREMEAAGFLDIRGGEGGPDFRIMGIHHHEIAGFRIGEDDTAILAQRRENTIFRRSRGDRRSSWRGTLHRR
jgi:aspartyl-tRNA synthetase